MSISPDNEIIRGFLEEVESYIPSLTHKLESLEKKPDQTDQLMEVHRLVHTIKGAASMVGVTGLSHIAFQMEEAVEDIMAGKLTFTGEGLRAMSRTVDQFKEYCRGFLLDGIEARAKLKETALAFRRFRQLPRDKDEEALVPLLESVPEREGGPAQAEEAIELPVGSEPKTTGPSPEMIEIFNEEAEGHLEEMGRSLNTLESQITGPIAVSQPLREVIRQVRRSVHTLKGAASMVGRRDVSRWAHSMEDLLDWIYEEARDITPEIVKVLIDAGDLLEGIVTRPHETEPLQDESLRKQFKNIMGKDLSGEEIITLLDEPGPVIDMKEILAQPSAPPADVDELDAIDERPEADFFLEQREFQAETPFRYSKTLRVGPERIDELVNLAGELSIALSGFDQKMAIFAEAVNELELSRHRLRDIARDLEAGYEVKALGRMGPTVNWATASKGASLPSPVLVMRGMEEFDALELDRYSELNLIIRSLNEAAIDSGAISTQLANLHSDFDGFLTRQGVLLSELQDKMMRLRMTPMAIIVNRMRRTVRELAGDLGKKVRMVITGEDIELDRLIWEKITDPLMHLLRNAVDHGIEPPALRQALGKPPMGVVKLAASREGNQVVIRIGDDGAGLNYQAIGATARRARLLENTENVSEEELASLIFYPGFSTHGQISEVSGRGVGLDVVKENIQELKGAVRVSSQAGKGTQFVVRIPLTLAVVHGLLFSVAGRVFAVPLNEISEIIRVDPANIMSEPEDVVRVGDAVLPLYYLARLLSPGGKEEESPSTAIHPLVLIAESEGRRAAMAIDRLIGQREIVIKNLGSHLRYVKGISGATIMGDGTVVPIINVEELLGAGPVKAGTIAPERELVRARPLEILIVDDSISVRQVVSKLMQAQGWNTQSARDGMEALDRVRERRPDLIVLDIEMPRMNGYEFMGALRAQQRYEDIPVIILTSRTAEKHREKAMSLGAKGFIVKPYKDEDFVGLVEKLTSRND